MHLAWGLRLAKTRNFDPAAARTHGQQIPVFHKHPQANDEVRGDERQTDAIEADMLGVAKISLD